MSWCLSCAGGTSPSSSSPQTRVRGTGSSAPLHLLLSINVCVWEMVAQQTLSDLFPLRAKHRPFPSGSQHLASAPPLPALSAGSTRGSLCLSQEPPCWAGFATGTGEPGRAGGASEVPKPRLEWGQAPAPPRAVLGALSPSTSSSFSAENPGKCHKQAVCARALGRRGAGRATAGLWSGGGAKCCVTGGNSSGVAVTRAGSWPSTSS